MEQHQLSSAAQNIKTEQELVKAMVIKLVNE